MKKNYTIANLKTVGWITEKEASELLGYKRGGHFHRLMRRIGVNSMRCQGDKSAWFMYRQTDVARVLSARQSSERSVDQLLKQPELKLETKPVEMPSEIAAVNQARSSEYGPPGEHFQLTQGMNELWVRQRNKYINMNQSESLSAAKEHAVCHGIYMIIDKIARAACSPSKHDHWVDIAGYSRAVMMALGMEEGQ